MNQVDLVSVGRSNGEHANWSLGSVVTSGATVGAVVEAVRRTTGDAVLFLAADAPPPGAALITRWLDGPADAWHGGLRLGLDRNHQALTHVAPLWMLTAPSDPEVEVTSPLLTLRALLVRREVIDQLGGPDPAFDSLAGAGIELGVRWVRAGAIVRYVPQLLPAGVSDGHPLSARDGIACATKHFGRTWGGWAVAASVARGQIGIPQVPGLARLVRRLPASGTTHYRTPSRADGDTHRSVSVILPTIDRYPYLTVLMEQLAAQTRRPHEVIVVDQTPRDRRRADLADLAPDLVIRVVEQDVPGQSTARNAALKIATGEFVLFIDDDDEIGPDLIENHLSKLVDGIGASSGGVDDATAGPPPPGYRHRRASDGFPTNNTMLRRRALAASGLFDPAFDGGPMEDHELGMRLHLSGSLLVYEPDVMVFHHHAPSGGLRTHGTRRVTRASSRRSLTQRNLPTVNGDFIALRYFTPEQYRSSVSLRILATFSRSGNAGQRLARILVQLCVLPNTLGHFRRARQGATERLESYVPVPSLPSSDDQNPDLE